MYITYPNQDSLIYWNIIKINFPSDFTYLLVLTWVKFDAKGDYYSIFPRIKNITKSGENLIFEVTPAGPGDTTHTVKNNSNCYKIGDLAKNNLNSIIADNISNGNEVEILPFQSNFEELYLNYSN